MPIQLICKTCSSPFVCYPSDIKRGREFCGLKCRSAYRFDKDVPAPSRVTVDLKCQECGNGFKIAQGNLTAYRKKHGRDPFYCSNSCSGAGRRRKSEETHVFTCLSCGKEQTNRRKPGGRLYREQKFCDSTCKSVYQRAVGTSRFLAAVGTDSLPRHQKRNGYFAVSAPSGVTGKKKSVFEHRFVMQQHLGRDLRPEETVHHINGVRHDNRLENLELFSSRHGPGQRVVDKISFAIEMLRLYPDFAAEAGVKLVEIVGGEHD